MARKIPSLGRFLGAPALYAMVYGEISSSLYYALGITAVYALSLTPAVFLAAGLLFALAAAAYAEGGATIPEPGGASAFARRAFNDLVGFIAGWATVLDFVLAISLSALFFPYYLAGALGHPGWFAGHATRATVVAVLLVVAVTVTRMVRRTAAYTVGVVVAVLDLVLQAGLAVFGLALLFSPEALRHSIVVGHVPNWNSVAFALPIAMIGYTGLEKVGSLTGVARDPEKTVPDSVRTSVFTVVLVYAAVATAAVSAFPAHADPSRSAGGTTELATRWVNTPILGLAHAIGSKGPHWVDVILRVGIGLTACMILVMGIGSSFSGCARLADAMGRHSQLPAIFARPSRRVLAPLGAIVAVGVLASGFLVVGAFFSGEEALSLASLYSFGILIAFMLTQAAIIWLRIDEPDLPRPFMMKGNVWIRNRRIPLPSVFGVVLSFAAWVIALGTHPGARIVGPLWMLAGLGLYAATRIRADLPLMERTVEAAPPPADVTEIAFAAVVVPLERLDALAEETMATACRLAADAGATVVGVSAIKVPVREPLDTPLPGREAEVDEVQAMAAALAADYGIEYRGVVARTRSPGRLVVDAAVEHDAGLIIVGSPYKRRLARSQHEEFFGKTVDFILRRAPCRVIVTHFPADVEEPAPVG
jgi:APA family basic amino acid/polyamine antiporter